MKCPILPQHINTEQHFFDAFGNMEAEVSARVLVRFAQSRGSWAPFAKAELDEFAKEDVWFNGLCDGKNIMGNGDGTYSFTERFVAMCYKSSPATDGLVTEPADTPAPDSTEEPSAHSGCRSGISPGPPSSVRMAEQAAMPTQTC